MLYTYVDIDHPIKQLQDNICYYFERLFDVEPVPYDIKLVLKPDFILLIGSSNKFKNYLKDIAEKYITLSRGEKDIIKKAYSNHLNIENLCNDTKIEVIKFTELVNEDFRKLLKEFLTWLWDDYDSLPKALRDEYKDVQDHFNEFKKVQKGKVCPFCGVSSLKPKTDRKRRNAYDHYIPKAKYPFVSINFKNLFPACYECNSDEKKEYDTPLKNGTRQKILFPFDTTYTIEDITIRINPKEKFDQVTLSTLLSDIDWEIDFTLHKGTIDIYDAWDDIFKIKTRYKEYILDFEDMWFSDFVLKKYNEKVVTNISSFDDYKNELINDSKGLMIKDDKAILRYIYFTFIFAISDIENKLRQVITV
ncbi:hypothetical protein [uncultured Chryseobacterium sp.]|uniref:hypothetical protein n=1 Tax=uncultured Chryseobacterium sp. TaxID=259322 RepID=UPI0025D2B3AC|nr:hypothetical protein [uncultured Chryseobacterium sp.]